MQVEEGGDGNGVNPPNPPLRYAPDYDLIFQKV